MKRRHASWQLWGWPLMLGVLTAIGLVAALFSDHGLGDVVAWLALGAPVATAAWFGWLRGTVKGKPRTPG